MTRGKITSRRLKKRERSDSIKERPGREKKTTQARNMTKKTFKNDMWLRRWKKRKGGGKERRGKRGGNGKVKMSARRWGNAKGKNGRK